MKAEELRIGNWILDRGDKVWQIDFWECRDKVSAKEPLLGYLNNRKSLPILGHPLTEYLEFIKPIPLTEEWLLKFGFVEFITLDVYPTYALKKINVNNGTVYVSELGFLNHIKHVHQLQNLYFSLTNEELLCTL